MTCEGGFEQVEGEVYSRNNPSRRGLGGRYDGTIRNKENHIKGNNMKEITLKHKLKQKGMFRGFCPW